jgi:dipeptidyl aminopeptidase/acylaminoacyl peptidase
MDIRTQKSELVFEDPDYDVEGGLIYSTKTRGVIGLYHSNTTTGRIYWDKKRDNFQKAFDKALPETDNYLVSFSRDENNYILYTENDFTPGAYYYGDRKLGELMLMFEQYPDILPEELTEHKLVTYKARDGIEIEGYLTLPKNIEGPVPAILHPHGGPGARDLSGFDYWTSFFTNRGYAVFRPNFRGSTGYGLEFAESQMQSWGLAMQDDLEDAALWLVKEGIAKKDKMCIVGASYGGYAAAMAAVKTPDLFQCAISFAGVTDLRQLVVRSRRYVNTKFVKKQIGSDTDDLEARSPYHNAEKIKIPMLIVHGEDDRIVDVSHSEKLAEELADLKRPVEFIELENGDHYLSIQRNRHQFFAAMDVFLKRHL